MSRSDVPLESAITARIMRYLKDLAPDGWWYKVWGSGMQRRGVPDIVGLYRGRFVALEVKRPQLGRASEMQMHTIELIRAAGGVAEIVTSREEARAIIERLEAGA